MGTGALYGREDVVGAVSRSLAPAGSLVTITGLPGSGRTSVALAATHQLGWTDGFTVIEGRPASRPGALAIALERSAPTHDLLVDDADHADGMRQHVQDLRRARPGLRMLLTSSSPVGLPGEVVVRLLPLPLPDPEAEPGSLVDNAAVRLFLDVARQSGTVVVPDDATVTAVARICHQLGGLPLAIRLVAARTATYSPATLATLLRRSPTRLLRARAGTDDPEHDLVKAVGWTLSLLRPAELELLQDLTVFRGPVAVEVVDTVCGRPELIDELSALVDAHLVDPHHDDQRSRFSIPPLVRDHLAGAEGGLPSAGVHRRHLRWAIELAGRSVALETSGRLSDAQQAVAQHEHDLLTALGASVAARDVGAATTLALALVPLAFSRGPARQTCQVTDEVVALWDQHAGDQPPGAAADRLVLAAWRELLRAETAESTAHVEDAFPVLDGLREDAREVDDRTLLRVTYIAVQAARSLVERSVPEAWAEEGRDLATRLDDPARLVRFETWSGMIAHQRGDLTTARAWAWTALSRAQALDDPSLTLAPAGLLNGLPPDGDSRDDSDVPPSLDQLINLARTCGDLRALDWLEPTAAFADLAAGDLDGACDRSASTLRRSRATGSRLRAGPPLLCLFLVSLQRGDLTWAGRLHGILGRYLDVLRPALPPAAAAVYDQAVVGYRGATATRSTASSDVMWGVRLTWDEGVDAALGYAAQARRPSEAVAHRGEVAAGTPPVRARSSDGLTHRERDVLRLLVVGGTNREISHDLGISPKTVMHHTSSIYRKIGVRGRAEAVAWSLRLTPAHDPR